MDSLDTSCNIESEFTRDVAEHEILLSFNSDEGAIAFYEWWQQEGEDRFVEWSKREDSLYG